MEEEVQTESLELTPEESGAIVDGVAPEEVARELPSEAVEVDFSKYDGVSREDIIRQMEAANAPVPEVEEETPIPEKEEEETTPADGIITTEIFDEYSTKYEENGGKFTEEDYKALEAKGISKKDVDERVEYEVYKNEKALNEGLKPYGDSKDIPDAIEWAKSSWTLEQREAFNSAVAAAEGPAQYALVGGLLQQFKASNGASPAPIHGKGNSVPAKTTGYATKSDYVKDANNPQYDRDPSYRAQVESKLAITDMKAWYKSVPKGI